MVIQETENTRALEYQSQNVMGVTKNFMGDNDDYQIFIYKMYIGTFPLHLPV